MDGPRHRPGRRHAAGVVISTTVQEIRYLRDPDVQLMLRVREGDHDAYAELVTNYQDRLVAVFYHLLRDKEASEDLAQEVFLKIYRARQRYVPTAKFATYLFRVANNVASNWKRTKSRRKEVSIAPKGSGPWGTRPEETLVADKSALMPGRQADQLEMREIVREAMDELSERQRMAVLLHKFEQMSYADIGDAMHLSPAAVKSLLSRAREQLRIKLEPYMRAARE